MLQPLSSGRWDATGSWDEAVDHEYEKAFEWANKLDLYCLYVAISTMADDVNAYTLYERKALLTVVALRLLDEVTDS